MASTVSSELPLKLLKEWYRQARRLIYQTPVLKRLYFILLQFLSMKGSRLGLLIHRTGSKPEYWENQNMESQHSPLTYTDADLTTSELLKNFIGFSKETSFLEIGCNAGRNLEYLRNRGFENLAGNDICHASIHECIRDLKPELYNIGEWFAGDAAEVLKKIPSESYDVVFSNAVLIHIPPNKISVFEDMVRISKKYIAIFTHENDISTWPYDFNKIFESLGCKLVEYRLFYDGKLGLPTERYSEDQHFYGQPFISIFVKKA